MNETETLAEEVRVISEKHAARVAREESRSVLKRFRRSAVVGFVILAAGLVGGQYTDSKQQENDRKARVEASNSAREAIVQSGNIVAVAGCNQDFRDREAVRGVLQDAQAKLKQARDSGQIPASRYEEANAFYKDQLDHKLRLPDCRDSGKILTTDPNKVGTPELPLYPGAPYADSAGR